MIVALQIESKESMKEKKRRFVIRAAESMSKKGQRNGVSVSLKSQKILF